VSRVILAHRPDLVALQEIQPEMMDSLKESLAGEYPYTVIAAHLTAPTHLMEPSKTPISGTSTSFFLPGP